MTNLFKKVSIAAAGLAALALGGSALAGAASSSTPSTSTAPSTSSGAPAPGTRSGADPHPGFPVGQEPGTKAHEDAEKAVTGEAADRAKAAATKAVPGTPGAVTTDFFGRDYEVEVTGSDGTKVTVHLDSSFRVMAGPGPGRPGHGFRGGPPAGAATPPGPAQQAGPAPAGEASAA